MTPDQTQRFYKKLLETKGVKNVSEVPASQSLNAALAQLTVSVLHELVAEKQTYHPSVNVQC